MTKAEHLLACLMEECAEVQQGIGKALRFGLKDKCGNHIMPVEKIMLEYLDVVAVYQMLEESGVLEKMSPDEVARIIGEKKNRVEKYMRYAIDRGTLGEEE